MIPIADLLSEIRLNADADLIMWETIDGAKIATPIARLLDGRSSSLLLGGRDLTASPQWVMPVTLRSESLPNQVDLEVVAFSAMTFTEFIGGVR